MADKKSILSIVLAAIVFFGLGIFAGNLLLKPVEKLAEGPTVAEELWWVYALNGEVTEVRDNIVYFSGDVHGPDGNPIKREVQVTADTEIILREREPVIVDEEEREQLSREALRQIYQYMVEVDWDPAVSVRELVVEFTPTELMEPEDVPVTRLTEAEATLEEIRPGDRILVTSGENIAANFRFEARAIYIHRF